MSVNDEALAQAGTDILAHLGDAATYTPAVGAPVSGIYVNLEKEVISEPDAYSTQANNDQMTIEGLRSDIGGLPVARTPNRDGDKFTIDGTDYEVIGVSEADTFFYLCFVREV